MIKNYYQEQRHRLKLSQKIYIRTPIKLYKTTKANKQKRLNSISMGCKTHVLHHPISDYHISI